jgi:nitroimidazol reductase NimA-like FMN-containing flavoprotein (pyridoxamine 5'-phosphate oxidase superfamily)
MLVMEIDRNGMEVLGREECLRLLGEAHLGRVGLTSGALPIILPVNYRLVGDEVLFRSGLGTKLDAATRNTVVAFEVDHFDTFPHAGWSVVVTGVARPIDPDEAEALLSSAPIARWVPGSDGHTVAISTELVSGRRILAAGEQEPGQLTG